jgi:hypothetical protein
MVRCGIRPISRGPRAEADRPGYGSGKLSAAEQTELDHLRTLYPDLPPDPDGLMMMRNLK